MKKLLGKHPSRPFNPLLANAFFRAGYIESWGRGIEKIHRECRDHGIEPPIYDFSMAGVMLTFRSPKVYSHGGPRGPSNETTPKTTPIPIAQNLLTLIQAAPDITLRQLADQVGLTREGVKYHLKKLKSKGLLRHVGSTRDGRWEIFK